MPGPSKRMIRGIALALVAAWVGPVWAAEQDVEPPRLTLRICNLDVAVPPFITLDPARPGWTERLLQEAARVTGVAIQWQQAPAMRCRQMLQTGESDLMAAAPVGDNLQRMRFPMKGDGIDRERRVASVNLVWVKRKDSALDWDGQVMRGLLAGGAPLKVGVRAGLVAGQQAAVALGYSVSMSSVNIHGTLRMLAAGRFDVVLGLQEEIARGLADPAMSTLTMMPLPLHRQDFYISASPRLPPETMAVVEQWWARIGQLRDRPEFNRD